MRTSPFLVTSRQRSCSPEWFAPRPRRRPFGRAPSKCRSEPTYHPHAFDPEADTFDDRPVAVGVCPAAESRPLGRWSRQRDSGGAAGLRDSPSGPPKVQGTLRPTGCEQLPSTPRVRIDLEEGAEDVRRFVYEPDTANPGRNDDPASGWTDPSAPCRKKALHRRSAI